MAKFLTEINVFPIKSLGGFSVKEAVTQRRGLQYDRRWMLVNSDGRFLSQREIPAMALLGTAIAPPYLQVFSKLNPAQSISIPLEIEAEKHPEVMVEIWDDYCAARVVSEEINQWFSAHLAQDVRLVYMPDSTRRPADGRYAPEGQHVSFADGFPFLIIGQASLDALNERLEQPLPMNRFRPNFVFSGGEAFEEDDWSHFSIQNAPFQGVKPCARCIIPTTDQDTAQRAAEPMKTLATFRKKGNKILFGQNVIWLGEGDSTIQVGQKIVCL